MQNPTRREWLGLLLAPLLAAAFAATAILLLSQPSIQTSGGTIRISSGVEGWGFHETFPQLLPTLIAFSFVYHHTILPYIRGHRRRSALVLTALAGPALSVCILSLILLLAAFLDPDVLASFRDSLLSLVTDPHRAFRSPEWFFLIAGISAVFTVFAVSATLLASRRDGTAEGPRLSPDWGSAARGCVLSAALLLPLLYLWLNQWKEGSDRAGCILNIRNVQQAVRGHNGMNNINPGQVQAAGAMKNALIGPGKFLEREPFCPAGGRYIWLENRTPQIGELMIRCTNPHHTPENHQDW